ncbi:MULTISPECIES: carbon starvation protein A [unclassified Anaerobiospirillum]|uniref:carbon starvation CstA family protein n=1 Tax=unclassified Anaerobiospirillum TaxID=2647410 RepID=UPI001FF32B23|nr:MULTISPECIES: carbon starvation protein A [unclassified Anaerobiospirillum]MCK0535477.1 carbon starvation protein A [Anaerobiospirillum sp. NML120511]MCK0540681.1 carbon starvation protein A [Anaerobiospirillum sp. NML02-A-032]
MPRYMWFIIATIALIVGYIVYGKIVEKIFAPDPNRKTPAVTKYDGVDYVTMPKWKLWLIQLLNIAGVGPVFGPIMGALYGPQALIWIVIGSIFAGAVHDYFGGMLSVRYQGANVPQIVGYNLGKLFKQIMRVFAVILLLLVGVVFATAPANLLAKLTPETLDFGFWLTVIFIYYFIATLVPIDKLIGRIYPIFGALLIIMAVGITAAMFIKMPENFYSWAEWGVNPHPQDLPLWPLMFITIACGALSGFHATQSPLMARCIENENEGRMVFYGGMIAEGFIGLVWCTVGMTFYTDPATLNDTINAGTASAVVYDSSVALMGAFGGLLAILGVIVLPITSGDTSFRAARLTIAEVFNFDQTSKVKRLIIAVPVFALGVALSQIDFNIIWRYFGWSNQTLAAIMLWTAAAYLYRREKFHWIVTIPGAFITAACITYILYEPNMGLGMDIYISQVIGLVATVCILLVFLKLGRKEIEGAPLDV